MRALFTLAAVLCLYCYQTKAQNDTTELFPEDGGRAYHHDVSEHCKSSGRNWCPYYVGGVHGDTTINNVVYKLYGRSAIFREEGQKVFFFNNFTSGERGGEVLMYDFNLQKGDSVLLQTGGFLGTYWMADSVFFLEDCWGDQRKCINLKPLSVITLEGKVLNARGFSDFWPDPLLWVQGVGSNYGFFYYHRFDCWEYCNTLEGYEKYGQLWDIFYGSCTTVSVPEQTQQVQPINIYGNTLQVNVAAGYPLTLEFYNTLGQLCKSITVTERGGINLPQGNATGVLFYRLINNSGQLLATGKTVL